MVPVEAVAGGGVMDAEDIEEIRHHVREVRADVGQREAIDDLDRQNLLELADSVETLLGEIDRLTTGGR